MKYLFLLFIILLSVCCEPNHTAMKNIVFLHHSTGNKIWLGKTNPYIYKLTRTGDVQKYFKDFNKKNDSDYNISDLYFPKENPYGWNNYPYDYYNIWVKNAGKNPYMEEPTLEILTKKYDVIIFKHCFPVSRIKEDTGSPDINSSEKKIENYKLQYAALKNKMHEFPDNKFIVWTPSVCTSNEISEEEAKRTNQFYRWMLGEWNEKGDNIFVWDFYNLETEGSLYLLEKNANSPNDSHPGREFATKAAPLFSKFIADVIESKIE